ncbi:MULTISPECIES: integrase [unclassified Mesorhizobium]|uniref:integrase n=1 Tax=unclassified Mesorhizobium TaxID=325217 RepID=UPI0030144C55
MTDPFARVPLFATDEELAVVIVGKVRAAKWQKERLPRLLEMPGFPAIDAFHGGRPMSLVQKFYEAYLAAARPPQPPEPTNTARPASSITKASGLVWQKRRKSKTPYWIPNQNAVKAGYRPKTVNLSYIADDPDMLAARCASLQSDMLLWLSVRRGETSQFDGTLKSLIRAYQISSESPYKELRPGSRKPYDHYLSTIEAQIGNEKIDQITGVDIKRWHREWSSHGRHPAAATMAVSVLDAAVSFGITSRFAGCSAFSEVLKATKRKLPRPKPRAIVLTATQIEEARRAAHVDGRPSSALAYAVAYETTLRLFDVIGQWWPVSENGTSTVQQNGMMWFGVRWEDIDENLVLRYAPGKTSAKTGRTITYPLASAPMVVDELNHWPADKRRGSLIVSEETGRPYVAAKFREKWRLDRKAAGIAANVWARDIRASGITEGRAAGASTDDAAKVAGHTGTRTTSSVYDRANLEAAERFAKARARARKQREQ